jgi:hypothetical protein
MPGFLLKPLSVMAYSNGPIGGNSSFVIWIIVAPVPVDGLLPGAQLNESVLLVVLGLVSLVRTILIAVPGVVVLVAPVVIAFVVVGLPVFLVFVVSRVGGSHHCNRCGQGGSQKK